MPNSSGFSAHPARTKLRWKTLRMVTAAALPAWPANPDWPSLVPAPASAAVRPVSVVRTHGSVTNPTALTGQSTGSTVLTVGSGGAPAIAVVDNGSVIGFSVTGPRTYTGGLRGGFRFAAIQLTSPGTVTLTAAGAEFSSAP